MSARGIALGAAIAAVVGLVLAVAGLVSAGSNDDGKGPTRAADQTAAPPVVDATPIPDLVEETPSPSSRAEVLSGDGFDPREIYRREAAGVVTVISIFKGGGTLDRLLGGGDGDDSAAGQGSGFVLNERGEIATNAHVITTEQGTRLKQAEEVYVEFSDGNQVPAKIIGHDPNSDVALIRVDPEGLDLDPLPLGTSRALAVGSPVAAIGSPFGQRQSLSVGVVSARDRSIRSLTDFSISGVIQTDAAINKGNSGGPLVDARGRVIGINSQISSETGDGTGVGFAVPIDTVKHVLAQLRENGKATYAYLGVSSQGIYPRLAEKFDLPVQQGAWLQSVTPSGPAGKAGLKAGDPKDEQVFQATPVIDGGDIITAVEEQKVRSPEDLGQAISRYKPGTRVTLEIWRGDSRRTVDVVLAERPEGSVRARPGATP